MGPLVLPLLPVACVTEIASSTSVQTGGTGSSASGTSGPVNGANASSASGCNRTITSGHSSSGSDASRTGLPRKRGMPYFVMYVVPMCIHSDL